jgi:hypothetical protein
MMLTLHRALHHAHAQANMPKRQPPTPQTIFLLFFGTSFPQNKGGGVGWGRAAAAAKTRSSTCSSAQGKRDKYRYEVKRVTDVPIGCILNR